MEQARALRPSPEPDVTEPPPLPQLLDAAAEELQNPNRSITPRDRHEITTLATIGRDLVNLNTKKVSDTIAERLHTLLLAIIHGWGYALSVDTF